MATVKVKLTLSDNNELRSEIADQVQERLFNERDARDYFEFLVPAQKDSKKNTDERKQNGKVFKGKRVRSDDYKGEPAYGHPGIHLTYKHDDELVFFSDKKVNFLIEVTPDPELVMTDEDLEPSKKLRKEELLDVKYWPFQGPAKTVICVSGQETAPLKLKKDSNGKGDANVLKQQYYKFSATVMGTPITLDPHIEIHDGD